MKNLLRTVLLCGLTACLASVAFAATSTGPLPTGRGPVGPLPPAIQAEIEAARAVEAALQRTTPLPVSLSAPNAMPSLTAEDPCYYLEYGKVIIGNYTDDEVHDLFTDWAVDILNALKQQAGCRAQFVPPVENSGELIYIIRVARGFWACKIKIEVCCEEPVW